MPSTKPRPIPLRGTSSVQRDFPKGMAPVPPPRRRGVGFAGDWNAQGLPGSVVREVWAGAKDKEDWVSAYARWRKEVGFTKKQAKEGTARLRELVKPYGINCAMASNKGEVCELKPKKGTVFARWFVLDMYDAGFDARITRIQVTERLLPTAMELLTWET